MATRFLEWWGEKGYAAKKKFRAPYGPSSARGRDGPIMNSLLIFCLKCNLLCGQLFWNWKRYFIQKSKRKGMKRLIHTLCKEVAF